MRVAPFGHPRISGYVLLPAAFRSLSRPSSAPSAKASALCSSSLDHFVWLITIRLSHPDTSVYQDAALLPILSYVQGLSFAFTRLLKTLICYFLILLRNNTSRCLLSFVCAFPRQSSHILRLRFGSSFTVFGLMLSYMRFSRCVHAFSSLTFYQDWRPPALPHRLQCSTIGRPGLNRRVRHGNGCFPRPYRRQMSQFSTEASASASLPIDP